MRRLRLSPSILTADFARLGDEITAVSPFVDWFHLDVMDGHYVPNLTFGPSIVAAVHEICDQPLHVHLMIDNPLQFVPAFVAAGAGRISFHPEVSKDPAGVISAIKQEGAGAGIAVHPDVDLGAVSKYGHDLDVVLMMTVRPGFGGQSFLASVLPKIADARALVRDSGWDADIEVDGGIKLDNVGAVVEAGAEIIVAGSAIYDGVDPGAAAKRMRDKLLELTGAQR